MDRTSERPLPEIAVVAAALPRDGRYLLGRRPDLPDGRRGHWEFPGGKVEPGETHEAALEREIREELEIEVRVGERVASVREERPGRVLVIHLLRCRLASGEPVARFHSEVAWVRGAELASMALAPADRRLADSLLRADEPSEPARSEPPAPI